MLIPYNDQPYFCYSVQRGPRDEQYVFSAYLMCAPRFNLIPWWVLIMKYKSYKVKIIAELQITQGAFTAFCIKRLIYLRQACIRSCSYQIIILKIIKMSYNKTWLSRAWFVTIWGDLNSVQVLWTVPTRWMAVMFELPYGFWIKEHSLFFEINNSGLSKFIQIQPC